MRRKRKMRPRKNTYIKKLGLEPVNERTTEVLRERIRKLKEGIRKSRYSGKLKERAVVYLKEHKKALTSA